MKKLGFTLVELLAVIAILAILIIIALPNILKFYNEAQMKLFLQEAQNINKAAENSYLSQKMGTSKPTNTTYIYTEGEETSTGNIEVSIIGKKPENGELIIRANGQTALAFHNGKYCAIKLLDSKEITVSKLPVDECVVVTTTPEECFEFDSSTGTIEGYGYGWEEEYQELNSTCPLYVNIPSKIGGVDVVTIGNSSFSRGEGENSVGDIIELIIPNSVTTIEEYAFEYNNLESATIPNSVTSIGYSAFRYNNLTSIVIPNSVTSLESGSFEYNNLVSVTIPNSLTSIGYGVFYNNQLTSVTIPSSITTFDGNPFGNNPNLTNIIVDNNNPNYISTNNSIYTKDGKTLVVGTKIGSNNILNTTTTIGSYAFYGMGLTNVTIPTSVITIDSSAFSNNQLTSVTIPTSVTSIGSYAFNNSQLTSITLSNNITSIGSYAFYGNQLTSVTIPNSVTSIGGWAFSRNRIAQGNFRIDNTSGGVTIGSYALYYNGTNGSTTITPTYLR